MINLSALFAGLTALGFRKTLTSTWAARPAADAVSTGTLCFFTDIGSAGAYMFSTGAIWKPVGGRLVFSSAADSSVTATLSETALATISIPGGLVPANATIFVNALFGYTSSANTKTCRIRLGGISGTAYMSQNATTSATIQQMIVIRCETTSAQKAQTGLVPAFTNAQSSTANTTSSVDLTEDTTIVISGQNGNTGETVTLRGYTVEISFP